MAYKGDKPKKMKRKVYEAELAKLEVELVKLQGWIKEKGLKIAVIFEGRDSAGKGGTIKRITRRLSPRVVRVVALPLQRRKKRRNGISSVTSPTCRQPGRWFSSTAAGITVQEWNG